MNEARRQVAANSWAKLPDFTLESHGSYGPDIHWLSPNSTWLVTFRLDTTRHVRRVEPMHFGYVDTVEQQSSTHSTHRARLA